MTVLKNHLDSFEEILCEILKAKHSRPVYELLYELKFQTVAFLCKAYQIAKEEEQNTEVVPRIQTKKSDSLREEKNNKLRLKINEEILCLKQIKKLFLLLLNLKSL